MIFRPILPRCFTTSCGLRLDEVVTQIMLPTLHCYKFEINRLQIRLLWPLSRYIIIFYMDNNYYVMKLIVI